MTFKLITNFGLSQLITASTFSGSTDTPQADTRLVSILGCASSMVGGRVQFGSLLLRANQTNTWILVEVPG